VGGCRIGMPCIVGKKDISDVVLMYVVYDILREIATVNHMNLLERMKEIGRDGITIAVFQNE
jgi:hypothetical protein